MLSDGDLEEQSEVHPKRQRLKAMDIEAASAPDKYDASAGAGAAIAEAEAAAGALAAAAAGSVLEAAADEPPRVEDSSVVMRLRGLPWSFGVSDVVDFFDGVALTILADAVTMMHNAAGEAFVSLESSAQASEAMQLNKKKVGKRYVEVFESSAAEREAASARHHASAKDDAGYRGVLRMRGLPYHASVEEILDFFGRPATLTAEAVHLLRRPDGRASGDAYVVFDTEEAAVEKLKLDKQRLGTRWVDIFQSTKGELYSLTSQGGLVSSSQLPHLAPSADVASPATHAPKALGEGYSVIKMRGLPWAVKQEDIISFLLPIALPEGGIHMMNGSNGRPSGLAYVELSTEEDQAAAIAKDKQSIGGRYIDIFACSQTELQARLQGGLARGNGFAVAQQDEGSFFVKLRGLPYTATEQQIAAFFHPMSVVAVQIAFNQQAQPSGFGFVQFRTAEDATASLTRSNQVLGSRYVEIFRCSRADMEKAHMQAASLAPMMRSARGAPERGADPKRGPEHRAGPTGDGAYSAYQAAMQTLQSRGGAVQSYSSYQGGGCNGYSGGYPSGYSHGNSQQGSGYQGDAGAYGSAAHQPASASNASPHSYEVGQPQGYGNEYSQGAYQQQYWGGY